MGPAAKAHRALATFHIVTTASLTMAEMMNDSPERPRPSCALPTSPVGRRSASPKRRRSGGRGDSVFSVEDEWVRRAFWLNASSVVSEWYSLAIRRFFAHQMRIRFVNPDLSYLQRQLLAASFFGMSLQLSPLGAVIFGHIGDATGSRAAALRASITLSAFASCAVYFLPSFAEIGKSATVIVMATQVASGLAVGAQQPGGLVAMYEAAPHGQRSWYTAAIFAQTPIGFMIASLVSGVYEALHHDEPWWVRIQDTSWRTAFLLTLPLAIPGLYFSSTMTTAETNQRRASLSAQQVKDTVALNVNTSRDAAATEGDGGSDKFSSAVRQAPLWELCTKHTSTLLTAVVASSLAVDSFWIIFGFWQRRAPVATVIALIAFLASVMLSAAAADQPTRFGLPEATRPRHLMIFGAVSAGMLAPPAYYLSALDAQLSSPRTTEASGDVYYSYGHHWYYLMAANLICVSVCTAIYAGPLPCVLVQQFPKHVRPPPLLQQHLHSSAPPTYGFSRAPTPKLYARAQIRFSGVGLALGFSQMLFSSMATPTIIWIASYLGEVWIGLFVSSSAFLAAAAVACLKEREHPTNVGSNDSGHGKITGGALSMT